MLKMEQKYEYLQKTAFCDNTESINKLTKQLEKLKEDTRCFKIQTYFLAFTFF